MSFYHPASIAGTLCGSAHTAAAAGAAAAAAVAAPAPALQHNQRLQGSCARGYPNRGEAAGAEALTRSDQLICRLYGSLARA